MAVRYKWALATLAGSVAAAGPVAAQDADSLEKRVRALEKAGGGQTVTRSKKSMSLTLSGHINRAVQFRDNGARSGVLHVTNNLSRTRVRWIGKGKISNDLTVSTKIELGNSSATSSAQNIDDNGDANGASALDERHIDLIFTSKTFGKLWMGQGATASEDTSENDLSGTGVALLNGDIASLAGSETFQLSNGAAQGRTVGNVFDSLDGLGRRDRIRYDTPKFAGFSLAASHGNSDARDVALHYGGSFGGVKVAGGIAWSDANLTEKINGSASVLLPFGLSFTVGLATTDSERLAGGSDADWRYAKVGYRFKALQLGETRLGIEYNENNDIAADGEEASYFGVGAVQIVDSIGAELYLSYHALSLDVSTAADPDDIDIVTIGARVKF